MSAKARTVVDTYAAQIFMAGDINTAKAWLRRHCYRAGLCVTVTPTDFIYTGGEEVGFVVGMVNYPRFPTEPTELAGDAEYLAGELIVECCQRSALVVMPDKTVWVTLDPPGASR